MVCVEDGFWERLKEDVAGARDGSRSNFTNVFQVRPTTLTLVLDTPVPSNLSSLQMRLESKLR